MRHKIGICSSDRGVYFGLVGLSMCIALANKPSRGNLELLRSPEIRFIFINQGRSKPLETGGRGGGATSERRMRKPSRGVRGKL